MAQVKSYDVIIYDDCSSPFTPRLAAEKGLGGVEWTLMLLAAALADEGLEVLVLNRFDGRWTHTPLVQSGWLEYGHIARAHEETLACKALVVSRWSAVPPVMFERLAFSLHDIPARWMFGRNRKWLDQGASAVCVSTWLAGKVGEIGPEWHRPVIAPMLLDECYEHAAQRDPNVFVYASAAIKGLTETLDVWEMIREHFQEVHLTRLLVTTNGYDNPSAADARRMHELGVIPIGQLTGQKVIAALRDAAGLFFVNDYPETHCMIASTALALGARCHVLTLDDPAALPETLAGSPLLTRDTHKFVEQFVRCYREPGPWTLPASEVPNRRDTALLPAWKEVLLG